MPALNSSLTRSFWINGLTRQRAQNGRRSRNWFFFNTIGIRTERNSDRKISSIDQRLLKNNHVIDSAKRMKFHRNIRQSKIFNWSSRFTNTEQFEFTCFYVILITHDSMAIKIMINFSNKFQSWNAIYISKQTLQLHRKHTIRTKITIPIRTTFVDTSFEIILKNIYYKKIFE